MTEVFVELCAFFVVLKMITHLSIGKNNEKYIKVLAGILLAAKMASIGMELWNSDSSNSFVTRIETQVEGWEAYQEELLEYDGKSMDIP